MTTFIIIAILCLVVYKFVMKKIDTDEAKHYRNRSVKDFKPLAQEAMTDMFSGMTVRQKSAVLDLMSLLAGFGPGTFAYISKINHLMKIASNNMHISANEYKKYKHSFFENQNGLVTELKSINDKAVLDCLFLSFFSVVSETKSEQAVSALLKIYSQLGYTEDDCLHILQKTEALSQMFDTH